MVDVQVGGSTVASAHDADDLGWLGVLAEEVLREVDAEGGEVVVEDSPLIIHQLLHLQPQVMSR